MAARLRRLALPILWAQFPHAVAIATGVTSLRRRSLANARALALPERIHDAVLELGLRQDDDVLGNHGVASPLPRIRSERLALLTACDAFCRRNDVLPWR